MIAGAGPIPAIPNAARAGAAAASADSGTIKQAEQRDRRDRLQQVQHRENRSLPMPAPATPTTPSGNPISTRRADRGRDEFDMADQRGGERRLARPVLAGERQRVEQPGLRHDHEPGDDDGGDRETLAGPGGGALQRIDDRQRSGAGQDPERRAERYPGQGRRRRQRCRRLPGRRQQQQQQRRGKQRGGAMERCGSAAPARSRAERCRAPRSRG